MTRTGIPSRHVIKTRTGLVAVVLAVTALLGTGPSISAAASGVAAADVECPPGQVDQRVTAGHQGEDPNTVSLAESQAAESALSSRLQARRLTNQSTTQTGQVTINVHWHVITRNNGTGAVSRAQIRRQLAVLNEAFAGDTAASSAPTVFRFTTASIDYTANTDWYNWAYPEEDKTDDRQAKRALHRGGLDDLNVYIAGLEDNLLGYATFPWTGPLVRDGVVLLNESLPGGSAEPFNEGDTATHEVGHWLGLLHTFQFGCRAPGDRINDTPYQLDGDNIFFCNESDDTCPQPGRDPVHNFMSYGDDPCLDRYTTGQAVRMAQAWVAFRADQTTLP